MLVWADADAAEVFHLKSGFDGLWQFGKVFLFDERVTVFVPALFWDLETFQNLADFLGELVLVGAFLFCRHVSGWR